jgi:hypothetical protein
MADVKSAAEMMPSPSTSNVWGKHEVNGDWLCSSKQRNNKYSTHLKGALNLYVMLVIVLTRHQVAKLLKPEID